MLTGNASTDTAINSFDEGGFAYLSKPITQEDLSLVVSRAFKHHYANKEQSHHIVEPKPVNIVIAVTLTGTVEKANKLCEHLLGYEPGELAGLELTGLFTQNFMQNLYDKLVQETRVTGFTIGFMTKTKTELNVLFTGTVLKNTQGRMIGLLGSITK
jgi:PAS domain-containing protein